MFNSGFRGKRASDGTGITGPQTQFIQNKYPVPTISGYAISGSDDTALNTAGGQTVLVNGGGFAAGCAVTLNGIAVTPVTVVSPTQISFTSPANTGGSYTLIVYNTTGGGAILVPGLTYSSVPTYTTAAGSIGSGYETKSISTSVVATSDSSLTYAVTSGSLPSGASMTSGGVITGTYPVVASGTSTTYAFDITATDAENQDVTRSFSLTTNIDVVTWVTPSNGATISLEGSAYSQALSATDAAGYSVSYSANALPTGLTLSSGTISGTPTVEGTTTTLLTATAATTNRAATNTVTWVVSLNDTYFKNTALLLSASSSIATSSFISDNSINNAQLTIAGDTQPNSLNPYQQGFYSVQYNGTVNDYISIPHNSKLSIMSGDTNTFVAECFVYWTTVNASCVIMDKSGRNGVSFQNWAIELDASKQFKLVWGASGSPGTSAIGVLTTTIIPVTNKWYHVAFVKSNADWSLFINGTRAVTFNGLNTANDANPSALRVGLGIDGEYNGGYVNGYISNVRVYNGPAGSAPYSATSTTLTVPTSPFLNSTYIGVVTNQSSRYIDNSSYAATITAGSSVRVAAVQPFSNVYQAGTQYYSTYFDGTGDYLDVSTPMSLSGDFTIEMWFYPTTVTKTYADLFTSVSSNFELGLGTSTLQLYGVVTHQTAVTAATWHHVALTRSGTTVYLYLDGVRSSSSGTSSTTFVPYRIGTYSTETFVGSISNLRVVSGSVLYSGATITPPTSPLTAVSGTQLLTCQSSTHKDNSTNSYTITQAGDAKPVAVSPFTPSSYTNTQITTYGSGYFDGTGDYLSVPYTTNPITLGTNNHTIEFWMYLAGSQSAYATQWKYSSASTQQATNDYYFQASSASGATFNLLLGASGSWGVNISNSASYTAALNNWTHIAITRSGNSFRLFANGIQVGSTATYSGSIGAQAANMVIGQDGSGNYMTGYISDFRIVNGTALYTSNFVPQFTGPLPNVTNTQLLTLQYNGSHNTITFKDNSGFNNVITKNGNTTNGTFSPYGDNWSVYLDGSSSLTFTNIAGQGVNFGTGDFTVELWYFMTNNTTNTTYHSFLRQDTATASFDFGYRPGATQLVLAAANVGEVTASITLSLNTWTHVAVSRSGTSLRFFVNGTQVGTTASNSYNFSVSGGTVRIGGNNFNAAYTPYGYFSNLRATKTALYTANFTPSTSPFVANSNTTLLACQSNRLIDTSLNNFTLSVGAGAPQTQKFSPFGSVTVPKYYSQYFTGSTNYVTVSSAGTPLSLTGDFTVDFWLYPTGMVDGSYYHLVSSGYNGQAFKLYWAASGGFIYYYNGGQFNFTASTSMITNNAWHHFAWVRSGSNSRLYINGTGNATVTSSMGTIAWDTTFSVSGASASENFPGIISNLRIVKGTAVYDITQSTITVPTSPLTAISGTSLLTLQSNTLSDNSSNKFTVTMTGSGRPMLVSPFTPTTSASISYSSTAFGGSMYFDGTGDYLQTATGLIHTDITQTDYTIEAWVYNQGAGAERYIFSQRGASSGWEMRINATNTVSTFFTGGTTFTSATTIKANEWTHIAAVRIGTALSMYINGIKDATGSGTQTNGTSAYASYGIWLGNSTSAGGGLMLGYISDARVTKGAGLYTSNFYPGASPATPATTLGTSTYLLSGTSGGVIDATRTVDLETAADARGTNFSPYNESYYSNYFDGSGDYLSIAGTNIALGASDFTAEFWINGSYSGTKVLLDWASAPQLYMTGTSLVWYWNADRISNTLVSGVWTHVAIVRASGVTKMYVNGVANATTFSDTTSITTTTITIGGRSSDTTNTLNGYMSNVRLVKGSAVYTTNFTPSTSPLTAIANTSLLTCQSNKFVDNSTNNFTITRNGDTKVATQNPFQVNSGISYYFDGTGDYLNITNSTPISVATGNYTAECWFYTTQSNQIQTLLWLNGNTSAYAALRLGINGAYINFYVADGGGSWGINSGDISSAAVTPNQWHYIAVTRSGSDYKVYLNGSQIGTTYTAPATVYNGTLSYIGALNNASGGSAVYRTMYGYIADVRVTRGVVRTVTVPTSPYKTN